MKVNKRKEKRDPRGGPSMADHWAALKPAERAVVLLCLNTHGGYEYDIHMGTLPFIPVARAVRCLRECKDSAPNNKSIITRILTKLKAVSVDTSNMVRICMTLKHKKVVRRFGDNTRKGHKIPFAPMHLTTAGLKWSLPHRAYIYDKEAKVHPMFTIDLVHRCNNSEWGEWSIYTITCPTQYAEALKSYMQTHCM